MGDIPNLKYAPTAANDQEVILFSDFWDIYQAIIIQQQSRLWPPLVRIDNSTVRVEATTDCPAETYFTGIPNILNSTSGVDGDLSDRRKRSVAANVSMNFVSGDLWGAEKASQWYAILAIADDADADFTLKAMPWIRVKSQTSQTISFGTNKDASVNIGYGFTANEFIGAKIYFFTGASKGLMRSITANTNGATVPGTLTYSGAPLSVAQGDWFIILPATNFKWLGDVWNSSAGNIVEAGDLIFGKSSYLWTATPTEGWFCPFTWFSGAMVNGSGGGGGGKGGTGIAGGQGGRCGGNALLQTVAFVPGTYYVITIGAGGVADGAGIATTVGAALSLAGGVAGVGALPEHGGPGQGGIWGSGGAGGQTGTVGEDGTGYGSGGGGGGIGAAAGEGMDGFLFLQKAA